MVRDIHSKKMTKVTNYCLSNILQYNDINTLKYVR